MEQRAASAGRANAPADGRRVPQLHLLNHLAELLPLLLELLLLLVRLLLERRHLRLRCVARLVGLVRDLDDPRHLLLLFGELLLELHATPTATVGGGGRAVSARHGWWQRCARNGKARNGRRAGRHASGKRASGPAGQRR